MNYTYKETENILESTDTLHSNLLKITHLGKYWIILKHIGGTFVILSGKQLHGISILWVEKQEIIGHIPILLVNEHTLVLNTIIFTVEQGDVYFLNLFNFLIINSIKDESFLYLTKNQMDINKVEMLSIMSNESTCIEYNLINSKVEKSVSLLEPPIIYSHLICQQLPQIIVRTKEGLVAISKETGLITVKYELDEYHADKVFSLIEFPNSQLGVVEIKYIYKILNLYDQKTGNYIEAVNINSNFLKYTVNILPLSLDGNLFIIYGSYHIQIIKFTLAQLYLK